MAIFVNIDGHRMLVCFKTSGGQHVNEMMAVNCCYNVSEFLVVTFSYNLTKR